MGDIDVLKNLDKFPNDPDHLHEILSEYHTLLDEIDDPTKLNFARAGCNIEAFSKYYGQCVDAVGVLFYDLYEKLIGRRDGDADGEEDGPNRVRAARRRRVKDVVAEDEFVEINNQTGKIHDDSSKITYLKNLEPIYNFFTKSGIERPRVTFLETIKDEINDSWLRDFFLTVELMLVSEYYMRHELKEDSRLADMNDVDRPLSSAYNQQDFDEFPIPLSPGSICSSSSEPSVCAGGFVVFEQDCLTDTESNYDAHDSEPEFIAKEKDEIDNNWITNINNNDERLPSKNLTPGTTHRDEPPPDCGLPSLHKKCGNMCKPKLVNLDAYLTECVKPLPKEPRFALLPGKEQHRIYQSYRKSLNIHLKEVLPELIDDCVAGFDEVEEEEEDDVRDADIAELNVSITLPDCGNVPLPEVESILPLSDNLCSNRADLSADNLMPSPTRDNGDLADLNREKNFERNKEMAKQVSEWHERLKLQIELSEARGALNMDEMAVTIMSLFPDKNPPTISFHDTFKDHNRRDVARMFFTCLQLTNEGNVDIERTPRDGGFNIHRLRTVRLKDVDGYDPDSGETSERTSTKRNRNGEKKKKKDKAVKSPSSEICSSEEAKKSRR